MRNNNNTEGKKMDFAEKVASNMKKGLSNEIRKVCEIGRVLRDVEGLAKSQVNYFMSIDEDFIPDVLQAYKGVKKRKPVSPKNNLNPWIDHPKKS